MLFLQRPRSMLAAPRTTLRISKEAVKMVPSTSPQLPKSQKGYEECSTTVSIPMKCLVSEFSAKARMLHISIPAAMLVALILSLQSLM